MTLDQAKVSHTGFEGFQKYMTTKVPYVKTASMNVFRITNVIKLNVSET